MDACSLVEMLDVGVEDVVFAQGLTQLLVGITVSLHLVHQIVEHGGLGWIVDDGSLVHLGQLLGFRNRFVQTAQFVNQPYLLGVRQFS